MNPPPTSYPYGLPPPGMPFPGPPGVPVMMPPGAAFRPPGVMPPVMPLQRPQTMRPSSLSRPPVLPTPTGLPVIVSPSPRPANNVLPPKSTTLYVGKIAPTVDDSVIRALLEACGPIKSWKRVQDPETQQPKGFGFCEYEEADGVLKALQLLNKLALDGQELLLKWNTATERYIEELQAKKERDAAAVKAKGEPAKEAGIGGADEGGAAAEDGGTEEGEDAEASKENAILEKIMAIVSEQATKALAHKAADQFLSGMRDDRSRRREDDRRPRPPRDGGDRAAERQLEAEFAREKEREKSRHHELQRAYEERERTWLKHERDAKARAEKDQELERAAHKERARRTRASLEHLDSDAEDEPWERKPIATSQRAQARKRLREKEEEEDTADRTAEAQERAAKAQRRESSEGHQSYQENGVSHPSVSSEGDMHVDANDPIYQAMVAAAKEQPKAAVLPPPPQVSAEQLQQERARQQAESRRVARRRSPGADSSQDTSAQPPSRPPSKPVLSVFGGDEEEDKPKRKLIPLTYTEDEKRFMQESQAVASPEKPVDSEATRNKVLKMIPSDKGAVFSYPFKWDVFDKCSFSMVPKLSQWVLKKTAELLGEEEHSMVEYVMNMLKEHVQPVKMIETLSGVMDNETEPFVQRLYQMVIYETERAALGILD